jgi:hypothetical protein
MTLEDIVEGVPEYKYFMYPEELDQSTLELAREYKDIVSVFKAGETRSGKDILCIRIGEGEQYTLWFGCPHPNEPIGTMVIEYLVKRLAENEEFRKEMNITWLFIKAADRDGLELNKGWLKGPFTIKKYALNYYRPAGNRQVEWTFPIKYKKLEYNEPMPETKAIMRVIEQYKPIFIYSLHNSGFGGVYYYLSRDIPQLYPVYWYYVEKMGVPLGLGEPEVPYAKLMGKSVYYMFSLPEYYDFLESLGYENPQEIIKAGTDSYDYAKRYNEDVVELVTEVPYFYDPRIEDTSGSGENRKRLILERLEEDFAVYNWIKDIYDSIKRDLRLENYFRESMEYFLELLPKALEAEKKWAETDEKVNREATVAEWLDNIYLNKFGWILRMGLFYRQIDEEIKAGNGKFIEIRDIIRDKIEEYSRILEKNLKYNVIPIKKLVTIQLASGLYTLLESIK